MQYAKGRPTVGMRVSAEAYEMIKKVSYDQRITLNDALDYLLFSNKQQAHHEIHEHEEKMYEVDN